MWSTLFCWKWAHLCCSTWHSDTQVILSFRLAFLLLFSDIAKVSSLQQICHSPSLLSLQFVSYSLFAHFGFLLSLCSVLSFLFHTSVFPASSSCTVTLFVRSLRPDEKKSSKVLLCFIWLSVLSYQLCFVEDLAMLFWLCLQIFQSFLHVKIS